MATGDFRYTPSMFTDIGYLTNKDIEICYLDNTYLHENFNKIPTRQLALEQLIELINKRKSEAKSSESQNPIFLLKFKLLGKEELLIDLFEYFQVPIVVALARYQRYIKVLDLKPSMFATGGV